MENIANKILSDREQKDNIIKSYTSLYQVVCLKANIPGINKNIKEAYVIVSIFDKKIMKSRKYQETRNIVHIKEDELREYIGKNGFKKQEEFMFYFYRFLLFFFIYCYIR